MNKRKTKKQQAAEILEGLLRQDGFEECKGCSTKSWKVYHDPDKCPLNQRSQQGDL